MELDGQHEVVVDGDQHLHILAVASSRNAQELVAAAEVVGREDREHRMGWPGYAALDCCGVCNCLDDRTGRQQVEGHMGQLAFRLVQHPLVLHYE